MEKYFAKGKFLLSAEYMVLHGAKALAIPLNKGQELHFYKDKKRGKKANVFWRAFDVYHHIWLEADFEKDGFNILQTSNQEQAETLQKLFGLIPSSFWEDDVDYRFETHLQFERSWGWGTSSTLVSLIAQCSGANPYELYDATFKGSGYDLACATANSPILYQLKNGKPSVQEVNFNPSFKNDLHFVYLGNKQNSLDSISKRPLPTQDQIERATELTELMLEAKGAATFCQAVLEHEALLSTYLKQPSVNESKFHNYLGVTAKSMGAWGGDFVMLHCSNADSLTQLKQDFSPVFGFEEVLQ